jgi:DNA polymerase-3 subunit gamma/tau
LPPTATTTELNNVQVVEALGVSDSSSVRLFLALILQKNIPALLKLVGDTYFAGIDLKHFTERSLEELRYLYLFLAAKESKETLSADGLDISQTHFTELEELTREVSLLHIERMAQVLSKTVEQLGWSTLPRFVLEMAAVRLTKVDQIQQIEAALLAPSTRTTPVALRMITNPTAVPLTTDNYETAPETSAPPVPAPVAATPTTLANSPPFSGGASAPTYNENSTAPQAWKSFVDTVMKRRPLLGALLSHANFNMETGEQGKVIVLAFAADSFYERQASDLRNKSELEEQIRQFFGREARLVLSKELSQTMRSLEETRNVEEAIIKKGAIEHPEVVKAKSLLGAEIVDVDIKE